MARSRDASLAELEANFYDKLSKWEKAKAEAEERLNSLKTAGESEVDNRYSSAKSAIDRMPS